ncbi:MAG TPA: hypothetical protein VJT83_10075 [Chitinophagaceae bacterium]|nr:hypothetical protein [Chitinophagaceae bacterium]
MRIWEHPAAVAALKKLERHMINIIWARHAPVRIKHFTAGDMVGMGVRHKAERTD